MIRLVSLLIWASLSIGGVASEGCFSNIAWPGLNSVRSSGGWNGLGKGFLGIFTPARMTDEQWKIIGKIKQKIMKEIKKDEEETEDFPDFITAMSGLMFLVVVSVMLIILFCAAPCALGVYWFAFRKRCKPKSNPIVVYTGIGCNSLAILTIFLSILFCALSIGSLTTGVTNMGIAFDPLPGVAQDTVIALSEQARCAAKSLIGSFITLIGAFPEAIAKAAYEKIPELDKVSKMDFKGKEAKIDGFIASSQELAKKLENAENTLSPTPQLSPVIAVLQATRAKIENVKSELSGGVGGGGINIKQTLIDVASKQSKASKEEIANKIKADQSQQITDIINKVKAEVDQQIDAGFKLAEGYIRQIKPLTDGKIQPAVEKVNEKVRPLVGWLNIVLLPCYLALASAIWSNYLSYELVKKEKVQNKNKFGPLIPISIGLMLAFIPLLASTTVMMFAGVTNVVCNTFFHDESMGYIPQALTAFGVPPDFHLKGHKIGIMSAIQECRNGTSLITILKLEGNIPKDLISKYVSFDDLNTKFTDVLNGMSFGLPAVDKWDDILTQIGKIGAQSNDALTQITALKGWMNKPTIGDMIKPTLAPIVADLDKFIEEVSKFKEECKTDVETAKPLDDAMIKTKILAMMTGDDGLLKGLLRAFEDVFLKIRDDVLTVSTNCGFAFGAFEEVGMILCDHGLGGFFGIYSAIGLGALSFFSACAGTVLIWHSLRAGKGPQDPDKPEEKKKSSKKSKKEEVPKVVEKADPMGGLTFTIMPPPGTPVQVSLDTTPSPAPNDAAGATPDGGVGQPPPVIVVNMDANKEDNSNKQKSVTDAGGATSGSGPAPQ